MTDKKIPKWLQKQQTETTAEQNAKQDAPTPLPKPKAPPPPKGPKNSRGFGSGPMRRSAGRGR